VWRSLAVTLAAIPWRAGGTATVAAVRGCL
jgi:hypothetical protein